MPKVRETLNEHYQLFHRTAQVPNIPEDQRPPPRARRSRRTHGSSRAASRDRSRSPDGSVPATRRRSPMPSASRHARSSSGSSLDNYPEGICIIEVLVSELQEEQIMGVSRSLWTSLWGFTREFYRCVPSSSSLVRTVFTNFVVVGTMLRRFLACFGCVFIRWLCRGSLLFGVLYLRGFCFC